MRWTLKVSNQKIKNWFLHTITYATQRILTLHCFLYYLCWNPPDLIYGQWKVTSFFLLFCITGTPVSSQSLISESVFSYLKISTMAWFKVVSWGKGLSSACGCVIMIILLCHSSVAMKIEFHLLNSSNKGDY